MNQLLNLLDDNIIDKRKLLTRNFKLLGLTESQALLILKLIDLEEKEKATINSISKHFEISRREAEDMISSLISSKLVKVKHTKKEMVFNLDSLWTKLLEIYYPPSNNDNLQSKINWFIKQTGLNSTPTIKKELEKWINNKGWNRMISIVENLSKLQVEINWKTIKELYISESKEKTATLKKVKEVIDHNWLLD